MFHKNICTGNVSKCDNPDFCTVSNLHAETRNGASKLHEQSEKKLEKLEKLSKNDVEIILERKQKEFPFVAEHIDTVLKNFDNVVMSQGEGSNAADHLRGKLDTLSKLLEKIEDDSTLLEVRLAELAQ